MLHRTATVFLFMPNGTYAGSFAIDYESTGVSLNDFSTAPIPEPGTLALTLFGSLALWPVCRKRRIF